MRRERRERRDRRNRPFSTFFYKHIKNKEQIIQKDKSEETLRQKEFNFFKGKVDQQSATAAALLQKYLDLLPKN